MGEMSSLHLVYRRDARRTDGMFLTWFQSNRCEGRMGVNGEELRTNNQRGPVRKRSATLASKTTCVPKCIFFASSKKTYDPFRQLKFVFADVIQNFETNAQLQFILFGSCNFVPI